MPQTIVAPKMFLNRIPMSRPQSEPSQAVQQTPLRMASPALSDDAPLSRFAIQHAAAQAIISQVSAEQARQDDDKKRIERFIEKEGFYKEAITSLSEIITSCKNNIDVLRHNCNVYKAALEDRDSQFERLRDFLASAGETMARAPDANALRRDTLPIIEEESTQDGEDALIEQIKNFADEVCGSRGT